MIAAGDQFAELCYNAMIYTIIKWTAMMAGALSGKVDAILMTGGMVFDSELADRIKEGVGWIAPVYSYPGSFETEAMAAGAIRVLSGQEAVKKYTGRPVWRDLILKQLNRWIYAVVGVIVLLLVGMVYAWSVISKSIAAYFPDGAWRSCR